MKKFLCAVLIIGMLCGMTALVGCNKDKGGNSGDNTESKHNNDSKVEVPGDWENPEIGNDFGNNDWGL